MKGPSKLFKGDITYVWILGPSITFHGRLTPAQAFPARLKALAKAGGNTCNLYLGRFPKQTLQVFHQDRSRCMKLIEPKNMYSLCSLHGQPAIYSCVPHVFSQTNPADSTAIGEATVARPSHAGADLLVREEVAIDRTVTNHWSCKAGIAMESMDSWNMLAAEIIFGATLAVI